MTMTTLARFSVITCSLGRIVLVVLVVGTSVVSALSSSKTTALPRVTIGVCTGPDCRVDGASDTLRQIQQCASQINQQNGEKGKTIAVKARNCLGPCGEGPCVVVLDSEQKKVYQGEQPNRIPSGSFIEADAFGADTKRTYQVKNADQVDFVMGLVKTSAGVNDSDSGFCDDEDFQAQSTRAWYDRNNNDRKVLQRLSQLLVVYGMVSFKEEHGGEIGPWQWCIAILLVLSSNFIMKDNLLEKFLLKNK